MKRLGLALVAMATACDASVPTSPAPVAPPSHSVAPSPPSAEPPAPVEPSPPPALAPRHILILGDSEACAVSWARVPRGREVVLATDVVRRPTDVVLSDCKGGTTVQYWNGRIRSTLARFPDANVAVVFLGTNHYWQKEAPDPSPILDALEARRIPCLWVGGTSVQGHGWPVYGLLRAKVEPRCRYFDTVAAGIPLWDGVHPDSKASLGWLEKVWPEVPEAP